MLSGADGEDSGTGVPQQNAPWCLDRDLGGGFVTRSRKTRRCYPARLLAVMTMKSAITISLTTHELSFIQSRAFGKNAWPR